MTPHRPSAIRATIWITAFTGLVLYQLLLFSHGTLDLFGPEAMDGTFNSMLLHLLGGDAGVSPSAIGFESFTRNGQTLAYFSIVPALLRAPALLVGSGFETLHLARLSCALAGGLFILLVLRGLVLAHESVPQGARSRVLFWLAALSVAFGGPAVYVANSAYVYSEPVLWGAVFAAGFNLVVLRAALWGRPVSASGLVCLASMAGLALNARPSIGIDLVVGFGLIWLWHGWRGSARWTALLGSALVVLAGVGVAGAINQMRWGSPLLFADFTLYDIAHRYPARLANILHYGTFNAERIPVSAVYYLTGVPYLLKHAAFAEAFLGRFYDALEGPPNSPLLTAPLWTLLALVGIRPMLRQPVAVAAMIGHAVAALLLCAAMTLTLRYRMDLAGLVILPAAFGYRAMSMRLQVWRPALRRAAIAVVAAIAGFGMASSFYVLVLAKMLNPAVPVEVRCALQPYAPFVPVNEVAVLPAGCRGDHASNAPP